MKSNAFKPMSAHAFENPNPARTLGAPASLPAKLFIATVLLSLTTTFAAQVSPAVGNWRGTLNTGVTRLRLVFRINQTPSGELFGKLDSPDQGARDIPVDNVSIKDKNLHFEVNSVQGVFEGTLDPSNSRATGKWTQAGKTLPLYLEKTQGREPEAEPEKLPPADLAASKLAAQKIAGSWNGILTAGTAKLRLQVKVSRAADGTATGTMDSLDQGAKDIPLSTIVLKEGEASFEARGIGGKYSGKLDPKGSTLDGQWQQAGQSFPLKLIKSP